MIIQFLKLFKLDNISTLVSLDTLNGNQNILVSVDIRRVKFIILLSTF